MLSLTEQADVFIRNAGQTTNIPRNNGTMNMTSAFSSVAVYGATILSNLTEHVPLMLCANIDLSDNHMVLESFESSLRMFKRGAWYSLENNSYKMARGYSALIEDSFFSYRNPQWHIRTRTYSVRSNCMFFSEITLNPFREKILITAVVDRDDFPFVMACRRHEKPIPSCLFKILISEDLELKENKTLKRVVNTYLMPKIMELGMMIKRVPQKVMDAIIYNPDMTFSSYEQMEQEKKSIWKIVTKELEWN